MNISKYISYIEATKSDTAIRKGIENIPNPEQLANMKYVATEIIETTSPTSLLAGFMLIPSSGRSS